MSATPTISFDPKGPFASGICGAVSLEGKEGYAVKYHTDGTVIVTSSQGEDAVGILAQGAGIGKPVTIALPGCVGFAIVSAAVSVYYDELQADTDGRLLPALATDFVCFRSFGATAGAAGDAIPGMVCCYRLET